MRGRPMFSHHVGQTGSQRALGQDKNNASAVAPSSSDGVCLHYAFRPLPARGYVSRHNSLHHISQIANACVLDGDHERFLHYRNTATEYTAQHSPIPEKKKYSFEPFFNANQV